MEGYSFPVPKCSRTWRRRVFASPCTVHLPFFASFYQCSFLTGEKEIFAKLGDLPWHGGEGSYQVAVSLHYSVYTCAGYRI